MNSRDFNDVARGHTPADILLVNGNVVNTFTGCIEKTNVALKENRIAGIGNYWDAGEIIDLNGQYITPGFIDGHIHLESSMLCPGEYAGAVVPRGILAVVTDFHEIANVCGQAGIKYILNYADHLPMDIFGMAPSCVPTTHLETSGARLASEDLEMIKTVEKIIGLGEVMNYPGVLSGDPEIMSKIELFRGMTIDGHAPRLSGRDLNSYISAGIMSDHECISIEEAEEKLRLGMHIMIREGSSEKNLATLLPLVNDRTFRRCMFVVDDRSCLDLLHEGDVDDVVRKAVRQGLDPVRAVQMVTINPAEYFRLPGLGAIAPGFRANLVVFEDLEEFNASIVFYNGLCVVKKGRLIIPIPKLKDPILSDRINIKPFNIEDLELKVTDKNIPVIEIIPEQIITKKQECEMKFETGIILPDISRDILKLAVVERHRGSGNIGKGMVRGFGLKKGALASTIAHDSHNILAVGTNDRDIYNAVKEVERFGGGLVVVADGIVVSSLPLPVAGLLSEEPIRDVVKRYEDLRKAARKIGCKLDDPFATLSFLSLPVIPEIRLTDLGLVDVERFKLIDM